MNMSFLKLNSIQGIRRSVVVGLAVVAMALGTAQAKELKAGDTFPDIAAAGLEGAAPDLKGKVYLVDFWASWCGPCKKAFPELIKLQKKYESRGFTVVGVSIDEDKSDMDKFLKKNPVPFSILRDSEGKKLGEKVDVQGVPTSFIVGGDGKVISIHEGFDGDKSVKVYEKEIEEALGKLGK